MSKKVKSLIERDLKRRLGDVDGVGVINPRGINAIKNNQIRRRLHDKGLRMTVVKNTLARRATSGSKIEGFDKLLDGPSAVVYGKASASAIARLLMDEKKLDDKLELRGVFFDGEVYAGAKGVEQVSKFPTREEAVGQIIAALLGPASSVVSALTGPGATIGALLSAIEERAEKSGNTGAAEATPAAATAEAPAPDAGAAPSA
jgi:large subunit ribosomal protein L10